jgi:DNA-binding response OmpR family regulator
MNEKQRSVLIAEDDPVLSKVASEALKRQGFLVDNAMNGEEALGLIRKKEYGIILLDLIMPDKTGFDVLHELQLLGNVTPVIVFSNLFEESIKKEALDLGAKDFIVKSDISIEELVQEVHKHLDTPLS